MAENKSNLFKGFKVLNELKEDFLNEIKLLYVFRIYWSSYEYKVLIVTNDDEVLTFGSNRLGILGFGYKRELNELTINEDLSHIQIIDFKNSHYHMIARTIDEKVYCWGWNYCGVLGNGKNDRMVYKPELNKNLSDKQIIDTCCGVSHSLVLTNSGQVYAWGSNEFGQIGNERSDKNECQLIPIKVNGFNEEKVIQISCGGYHSMALTESGRVFSWGRNISGQLGLYYSVNTNKPLIVSLSNKISIKKISCGSAHSLLLSCDGDVYWFGDNEYVKQTIPKKINENKFIDIELNYDFFISIALSMNGIYYVWGKCEVETIKELKETEFKSFDDIFCQYFGITHKTIHRLKESMRTLNSLKDRKYESNFEEIGSSFGNISKAIEKKSKKTFAIKKILSSKEQRKNICEESKNILKINQKFIVQCFDVWIGKSKTTSFVLYVKLESCYCSLSEAIDKLNKEFDSEKISSLRYYISSELFIELLECVQYLHKQNPPLIHCSIDAQNLKITFNYFGRLVKFEDFDIWQIHNTYNEKSDIKVLGEIAEQLFDLKKNER
jgi:alpha-tubulin suppressor-like RCC1 family protein